MVVSAAVAEAEATGPAAGAAEGGCANSTRGRMHDGKREIESEKGSETAEIRRGERERDRENRRRHAEMTGEGRGRDETRASR